jgi:tetratricopeptide (TPR) repeat protein
MGGTERGYTARRGRLKGVEVKPGAVKQARLEAGLSLAGVAGGDLTRAAIHLIESGKSRPSMPTLELIAARTNKPLSYFMADPQVAPAPADSRVGEVERLVSLQDHQAAIQAGEPLLGQITDPYELARLRRWLGEAYALTRRSEAALEMLRPARRIFEQRGDRWMALDCLDWEAVALTMEQDPRALETAERALALCRELDNVPPPTEARILGHLANVHVLLHNWEKAVSYYERAVEVAGKVRDLARMARMYQGLSIAYHELGNTAQELTYSHKALALHSLLRDKASVAAAENNLGLALMKTGDLAGAERQLASSLRHLAEIGVERGKSHVLLSLAELRLVRGSYAEAEAAVMDAIELADRLGERLNVGLGHQFMGRLAALRGDDEMADRSFEHAIAIFTGVEASERLVECHSIYAEILEQRGDTQRALDHARMALAVTRPNLVQGRGEAARGEDRLTG